MTLSDIRAEMPPGCHYELVTTEEQLDEWCARMRKAPLLGVDTETEGIDFNDVIVGVCIATAPGEACYIPVRHTIMEGTRHPGQLDPTLVFSKIGPILEEIPCTGHNVKFDLQMFWKEGVDPNFVDDTFIQANLAGYEQGERGLKALVKRHFDHHMAALESLFPQPKGNRRVVIRPAILSPEDIFIYACEDADFSLQLRHYLVPVMLSKVEPVVYRLEMDLVRVVAEMEMWGVPVDTSFLKEKMAQADEMIERLNQELHGEIRGIAGDPDLTLNFVSYPQLRSVLYDYLKLPVRHYTPKGDPSTAGHVLEELAKENPTVERILTYRLLCKLRSFLEKMLNATQEDGRIRGNFNQVGTASGRFSSSNPNLQQIPKDQTFVLWPADLIDPVEALGEDRIRLAEEGERYEAFNPEIKAWKSDKVYLGPIVSASPEYGVHNGRLFEMAKFKTRKFIAASADHYIIEADYSQIELRIMAGESREPTLLDAYASGDDVHARTAAVIFDVPFSEVTKEQRSVGKTINFGLLYGAGPQRISQELNISVQEAKEIVNKYFQNLPSIKNWINRTKETSTRAGLGKTRLGRIRYFPNIKSRDHALKAREEREAVNHVIQGSAADVMKFALVRTSKRMRKHFGDRVKLICTVHDSLMLECHKSCPPDEVVAVLKDAMEGFNLCAAWPSLLIDVGIGPSWGDTDDWEGEPVPMPPPVDGSSLPKLRVRFVGREREGFFETEDYFVREEGPEPEQTVEEALQEAEARTPQPALPDSAEYEWVLDIHNPLSKKRMVKLIEFLKQRTDVMGDSSLVLSYPDKDGTLMSTPVNGRLFISREDEEFFRLLVGPCILKQDIEKINPAEAVKNITFGSAV